MDSSIAPRRENGSGRKTYPEQAARPAKRVRSSSANKENDDEDYLYVADGDADYHFELREDVQPRRSSRIAAQPLTLKSPNQRLSRPFRVPSRLAAPGPALSTPSRPPTPRPAPTWHSAVPTPAPSASSNAPAPSADNLIRQSEDDDDDDEPPRRPWGRTSVFLEMDEDKDEEDESPRRPSRAGRKRLIIDIVGEQEQGMPAEAGDPVGNDGLPEDDGPAEDNRPAEDNEPDWFAMVEQDQEAHGAVDDDNDDVEPEEDDDENDSDGDIDDVDQSNVGDGDDEEDNDAFALSPAVRRQRANFVRRMENLKINIGEPAEQGVSYTDILQKRAHLHYSLSIEASTLKQIIMRPENGDGPVGATRFFMSFLRYVNVDHLVDHLVGQLPDASVNVLGDGNGLTAQKIMDLPRLPNEEMCLTGVYLGLIEEDGLYTGSARSDFGFLSRFCQYDRIAKGGLKAALPFERAIAGHSDNVNIRALYASPVASTPAIYTLCYETLIMILVDSVMPISENIKFLPSLHGEWYKEAVGAIRELFRPSPFQGHGLNRVWSIAQSVPRQSIRYLQNTTCNNCHVLWTPETRHSWVDGQVLFAWRCAACEFYLWKRGVPRPVKFQVRKQRLARARAAKLDDVCPSCTGTFDHWNLVRFQEEDFLVCDKCKGFINQKNRFMRPDDHRYGDYKYPDKPEDGLCVSCLVQPCRTIVKISGIEHWVCGACFSFRDRNQRLKVATDPGHRDYGQIPASGECPSCLKIFSHDKERWSSVDKDGFKVKVCGNCYQFTRSNQGRFKTAANRGHRDWVAQWPKNDRYVPVSQLRQS
ncbi:uncharacterized protein J3D65DRAFT_232474 [Phyllosticta citribraziliensis]|uniref:GATA-type domain-containing protein n=1 Tax=Phyllosticta citribraziliensis TaxID=989973 RepID=A0ABR1M5L8_9PEZI